MLALVTEKHEHEERKEKHYGDWSVSGRLFRPLITITLAISLCGWAYHLSLAPRNSLDLLVGFTVDLREWSADEKVRMIGPHWFTSAPQIVEVRDGIARAIYRGEALVCSYLSPPSAEVKPQRCIKVIVP